MMGTIRSLDDNPIRPRMAELLRFTRSEELDKWCFHGGGDMAKTAVVADKQSRAPEQGRRLAEVQQTRTIDGSRPGLVRDAVQDLFISPDRQ